MLWVTINRPKSINLATTVDIFYATLARHCKRSYSLSSLFSSSLFLPSSSSSLGGARLSLRTGVVVVVVVVMVVVVGGGDIKQLMRNRLPSCVAAGLWVCGSTLG